MVKLSHARCTKLEEKRLWLLMRTKVATQLALMPLVRDILQRSHSELTDGVK